jgi:hypothetical protein
MCLFIASAHAEGGGVLQKRTIQEMNEEAIVPSQYFVEGHVVQKYRCPPCPKDAECAKCWFHQDHIIVSDKKKNGEGVQPKDYASLTKNELILFTKAGKKQNGEDHQNAQFKSDKKYRFKVFYLGQKTELGRNQFPAISLIEADSLR